MASAYNASNMDGDKLFYKALYFPIFLPYEGFRQLGNLEFVLDLW